MHDFGLGLPSLDEHVDPRFISPGQMYRDEHDPLAFSSMLEKVSTDQMDCLVNANAPPWSHEAVKVEKRAQVSASHHKAMEEMKVERRRNKKRSEHPGQLNSEQRATQRRECSACKMRKSLGKETVTLLSRVTKKEVFD